MSHAIETTKPGWFEAARALSASQYLQVLKTAVRDGAALAAVAMFATAGITSIPNISVEANCAGQADLIDSVSKAENCTITPLGVTADGKWCVSPNDMSCPVELWGINNIAFPEAGKAADMESRFTKTLYAGAAGFGLGLAASFLHHTVKAGRAEIARKAEISNANIAATMGGDGDASAHLLPGG